MAKKVNLHEKPYCLNDKQIDEVESLVSGMSLDDKLKQLFICLTKQKDEEYLKNEMALTKCGGVRYNPGLLKDIYSHNYFAQKYSEIPLFTCANTEEGGNGAFVNGTFIGSETKVAATNDKHNAYILGDVSAKEAKLAAKQAKRETKAAIKEQKRQNKLAKKQAKYELKEKKRQQKSERVELKHELKKTQLMDKVRRFTPKEQNSESTPSAESIDNNITENNIIENNIIDIERKVN